MGSCNIQGFVPTTTTHSTTTLTQSISKYEFACEDTTISTVTQYSHTSLRTQATFLPIDMSHNHSAPHITATQFEQNNANIHAHTRASKACLMMFRPVVEWACKRTKSRTSACTFARRASTAITSRGAICIGTYASAHMPKEEKVDKVHERCLRGA